MKNICLFAILCIGFCGISANAKEPSAEFYRKNISSLYKTSNSTAHIEITGYKLIKEIRGLDLATGKFIGAIGYRLYKIEFRVIETYKGKIRSSSPFTMSVEYPGKPPLGEFIASFDRDGKGNYYLADSSLFMVPAKLEFVRFARSLK